MQTLEVHAERPVGRGRWNEYIRWISHYARRADPFGLSWVWPWDERASWDPRDTANLSGRGAGQAATQTDQVAGQMCVVGLTGDWIDGKDASAL
jgi:hypothetical protein